MCKGGGPAASISCSSFFRQLVRRRDRLLTEDERAAPGRRECRRHPAPWVRLRAIGLDPRCRDHARRGRRTRRGCRTGPVLSLADLRLVRDAPAWLLGLDLVLFERIFLRALVRDRDSIDLTRMLGLVGVDLAIGRGDLRLVDRHGLVDGDRVRRRRSRLLTFFGGTGPASTASAACTATSLSLPCTCRCLTLAIVTVFLSPLTMMLSHGPVTLYVPLLPTKFAIATFVQSWLVDALNVGGV